MDNYIYGLSSSWNSVVPGKYYILMLWVDSTHSHANYSYASYQHQAIYTTAESIHMLLS